jgi:UDP-N-acetylenolpyruvoylglucosamine reductase
MYLYSKKTHILINFFTAKVSDMMSLGEFLVQKTKENYHVSLATLV